VTRHGEAPGRQDDEAGSRQALDARRGARQGDAGWQQRIEPGPDGRTAASRRVVGRRAEEGRPQPMMTIVTRVTLEEGSEPAWDAAMRERMESRVIIGTWETRADWETCHADPKFQETRKSPTSAAPRSGQDAARMPERSSNSSCSSSEALAMRAILPQ
jgi:hypothetical protein